MFCILGTDQEQDFLSSNFRNEAYIPMMKTDNPATRKVFLYPQALTANPPKMPPRAGPKVVIMESIVEASSLKLSNFLAKKALLPLPKTSAPIESRRLRMKSDPIERVD